MQGQQLLREHSALVPLAAHRQGCRCQRLLTLLVEAKQQRRRAAPAGRKKKAVDVGPSTTKGFGQMLIDDDSIISVDRGLKMPGIPFYAAYNQPGYAPSRYVGPIELKQLPGAPRQAVAAV